METKIIKKLSVVIGHWIEHNREHGDEFEKWVRRAKMKDIPMVLRPFRRRVP